MGCVLLTYWVRTGISARMGIGRYCSNAAVTASEMNFFNSSSVIEIVIGVAGGWLAAVVGGCGVSWECI
jgi:hypothetical protein